MKWILSLKAIGLILFSTASGFQGGGGESTKRLRQPVSLGQRLRRVSPLLRDTQEYTESGLNIIVADGISKSTALAFAAYIRSRERQFKIDGFELFAMPGSTEQFLVAVPASSNDKSYPTCILLLLRKHGADITEGARFEKEGSVAQPYFLIGRDRVLLIVWNRAYDGAYYGTSAFEYRNETLKALGEIGVTDRVPNELIYNRSPIESATAEYKRGTYYLTMRGRGNLYSWDKSDNRRRLARRGVPVTYVYEEGAWVPAGSWK